MKARTLTAALVLAAAVAAPLGAQAASGNLSRDIQHATNSGSVNATFSNGVVTLTGNVSSAIEANRAERAALGHSGVERVINLIDSN